MDWQERAAPDNLIQMSRYSSRDLFLSMTIEVLLDKALHRVVDMMTVYNSPRHACQCPGKGPTCLSYSSCLKESKVQIRIDKRMWRTFKERRHEVVHSR